MTTLSSYVCCQGLTFNSSCCWQIEVSFKSFCLPHLRPRLFDTILSKKNAFQVVFLQFLLLYNPMLLSTIQLSIRNPGFTFNIEPSADMSDIKVIGLVLLDMLFFLTHPLILKFRSSGLRSQQDAIKASRNLSLSPKYKKNLEKIIKLEDDYYAGKRIELNLETISQITLSLILFLYSKSETTTSNSLKGLLRTVMRT